MFAPLHSLMCRAYLFFSGLSALSIVLKVSIAIIKMCSYYTCNNICPLCFIVDKNLGKTLCDDAEDSLVGCTPPKVQNIQIEQNYENIRK